MSTTCPAANAPLAKGLPDSYQSNCNGSPSGSDEREPSRITVALVPLDEMTISEVALASATGELLTRSTALELVAGLPPLVAITEYVPESPGCALMIAKAALVAPAMFVP